MNEAESSVEEPWPDSYEAPTLEPLGSVWDRTGGAVGLSGDGSLFVTL